MIEWLKFQWAQYRIHRQMDRISRAHDIAEEQARANSADGEKLHEIGYEFYMEHELFEDEINQLTTRYYTRLANRLMIPIPKFEPTGGAWGESAFRPGRYYLTTSALHELRAAIRAEKRARTDAWLAWLPLITGLVGILGALIGLVAVIKK